MNIVERIQQECIQRKKKLAFAESCSGGALAARVVANPGASQFFLGSVVAYSPDWKNQFLLIDPQLLKKYGAESEPVVREMVSAILDLTETDYALAITGFAGPTGASPGKIHIGIGERDAEIDTIEMNFVGTRSEVIHQAVDAALEALLTWIQNS